MNGATNFVIPETIQDYIDHTGNWDWENKHVTGSFKGSTDQEQARDVSVYDVIESGTVLIAAGPADLEAASKNAEGIRIVPIGLVETVQVNMNKPLSRIFEIGSKLSYIIPGRTVGGIAINRVFFDGPSLLKVLYAGEVMVADESANVQKKTASFASNASTQINNTYQHIGSGNIAMNLASTFFDQPVGLAFLFRDRGNDNVGQIYFEGCRVSAYNLGISANMNVLTESINMEFIRCRPIITTDTKDWAKGSGLADLNIVAKNGPA